MAKAKSPGHDPKCPHCGSFLQAYPTPLPDLLLFGGDEAARAAFMTRCGPFLGECKFCDLRGLPWPSETP